MKVSFFGHRNFIDNQSYEKDVTQIFNKLGKDESIEILLGGYGNFDRFAFRCAKKIKAQLTNITITKVAAYLNEKGEEGYDTTFYPSLENVPHKYTILHRNRKMVDESDLIIVYITHSFGGAYRAVKRAKLTGKAIINLADYEI